MKKDDSDIFYAETLDLQARLCATETRKTLSELSAFINAQKILEVGCGAGAQVGVLDDLLSGKEYLGVDVSDELLSMAQKKFPGKQSVRFLCQDILTFSPKQSFDFVLSFAVLQHLSNTKEALQKYAQFISKNGAIAIYDVNDQDEFQSNPDLPELRRLYRSITEEGTCGKRKSHCLREAKEWAHQFGLEVIVEKQSHHKIETPELRQLFLKYAKNVGRVIQMKYHNAIDLTDLNKELENWFGQIHSWITLTSGSWLVLKKA